MATSSIRKKLMHDGEEGHVQRDDLACTYYPVDRKLGHDFL